MRAFEKNIYRLVFRFSRNRRFGKGLHFAGDLGR